MENVQNNYQTSAKQTIHQNEQYFNEYVNSLESYDHELKKLVQIKEETDRELLEVKIDRAAKYKFLGAALILLRNMEK